MERMDLRGKTALVTGGAGGIGARICVDLAELGATVIVADINIDAATRVAGQLNGGRAAKVDLSDSESIQEFAADLSESGPVDILVNNAGWDRVGPFVDSSPSDWDRLIAINLRAPIHLTHSLLPGMMQSNWGRVVFVSSDAARVGSTGEAVYGACKAGIIGFSKTIARESARFAVTSNVVCPGPSDTPLLQEVAAGNPKLVEALKKAIPLRRLGTPEDIAGMVTFFCTPRAEYITGQTISVSGGLTMI